MYGFSMFIVYKFYWFQLYTTMTLLNVYVIDGCLFRKSTTAWLEPRKFLHTLCVTALHSPPFHTHYGKTHRPMLKYLLASTHWLTILTHRIKIWNIPKEHFKNLCAYDTDKECHWDHESWSGSHCLSSNNSKILIVCKSEWTWMLVCQINGSRIGIFECHYSSKSFQIHFNFIFWIIRSDQNRIKWKWKIFSERRIISKPWIVEHIIVNDISFMQKRISKLMSI